MILTTDIDSTSITHYIKSFDAKVIFELKSCPSNAWVEMVDTSLHDFDNPLIMNFTINIDSYCDTYRRFKIKWTSAGFVLVTQGGDTVYFPHTRDSVGRTYVYLKSRGPATWKIRRETGTIFLFWILSMSYIIIFKMS